jgi:diguanylate cyclase (GGDEF)-like protein
MRTELSIPSSIRAGADPIELSPGIWWVGCHLDDDAFQCHAYLIVDGDQSILIDPGSALTWSVTLEKIERIIPFQDIRWIVLHHQDPDICGAMPKIDDMIERDDARWVVHWRGEALLKHYGTKTPFFRIEDHDWALPESNRKIEFVFTPYLHFPGAFTTFDHESGILFSSDLFGGFTQGDELIVQGSQDFEGVELFHQHYMPNHETLLHSMLKVEKLPLQAIAPQHGRIITNENIPYFISRLKSLDCGLYLLTNTDSNLQNLQALNDLLRDTVDSMVLEKDFRVIVDQILGRIRKLVPIREAEIIALIEDGKALRLSSKDRFRGQIVPAPKSLLKLAGKRICDVEEVSIENLPLVSSSTDEVFGIASFHLEDGAEEWDEFDSMMQKVALPLAVACEREVMFRQLELERDLVYERSIRDPLTSLLTRRYLDDSAKRMIELHLRNPKAGFAMVISDIDFFKKVNDTYGHLAGDKVLIEVAQVLRDATRKSDLAVRFGGEEFALLLPMTDLAKAEEVAQRIRESVKSLTVDFDGTEINVTLSLGVAVHRPEESMDDLLRRADEALYRAKESGRNRVELEE